MAKDLFNQNHKPFIGNSACNCSYQRIGHVVGKIVVVISGESMPAQGITMAYTYMSEDGIFSTGTQCG